MTEAPMEGYRLSPQQRHLWRLQQDSRAFRSLGTVRIDGPLDREQLRRALAAAAGRHEVLRTSFRRSPGIRFPIQVVTAGVPPAWQEADLAGLDPEARRERLAELERQAATRPFDLERGPLVHAALAGLAAERHLLLLALPALCADERSLENLVRELAAAYAEEPAGTGDDDLVQYAQVSEWQHELLASDEAKPGRDFWRDRDFGPLFAVKLPLEGKATGGFAPRSLDVGLGAETAARLDAVAAATGTGAADLLLAAWLALLARLTGELEVGAGVLFAGRVHEEFQAALGPFARSLPVSARIAHDLPFAELAARVAAAVAEAADWQDFFAADDGDRGVGGVPAAFAFAEAAPAERAAGLTFVLERSTAYGERFKAALVAHRRDGAVAAELHYDGRLFPEGWAEAAAERFRGLLESFLARPEAAVGEAEVLSAGERRRLLEDFNATAAALPEGPVHRLFAEQARRTPGATALEHGGERLTYAELAQRADRLARALAARGVGPDRVVGLCVERSPEMVVGILGVLAAGGAYLPLDSTYPEERLAFLLEDSGAMLLLTQERLLGRLPPAWAASGRTLLLDGDPGPAEAEPAGPPPGDLGNLAYVIYTSGSTGMPKGVMVPHGGLANYLGWATAAYRAGEGRGAPVHSPIGFDLTVTSLFAPLLTGGSAVLLPEDRGIEALGETVAGPGGFSLVKLTPAHLAILARPLREGDPSRWTSVLVVGGEALLGESLAALRERAPETRVVNEYGPTETVVGCCVYEAPAAEVGPGPVPIGRPIANTRIYLLDARLRPVPEGVAGELYVGGAGLARGYLGRPDLTAERFVPDLLGSEPGTRLYKTGDLARFLPGGLLDFLGRNDHQVKVRGVRLELGEVEAVLAAFPGVREAAVAAREDTPGDRRLVAYYAAEREPAPKVDELRRFLAGKLPDAMVPSVYVQLPALPLTGNGKVDRAALPAPGSERPDLEREYVAPRSAVEEALAGIWREVLGLDKVGVLDSFFALGGDSIRSVRVIALAREQGLELTVEQLFRRQTVAALAEDLAAAGAAGAAPGEAAEDEEMARLVAELEGLSEEEVQARLREQLSRELP